MCDVQKVSNVYLIVLNVYSYESCMKFKVV